MFTENQILNFNLSKSSLAPPLPFYFSELKMGIFPNFGPHPLRILATLEAKTPKTSNFWMFCTVILLILHVSRWCIS